MEGHATPCILHVSQVSCGDTIGLVATMKFHSECDILSQQSVHIRASNSLSMISKRAKTSLDSMLPKRFKSRNRSDVTAITPQSDVSGFPILNLSEEPKHSLAPPADMTCHNDIIDTALQGLGPGLEDCSEFPPGDRYNSKSDVESGLGSQNLANTTSEDSLQLFDTYTSVQRSQSIASHLTATLATHTKVEGFLCARYHRI